MKRVAHILAALAFLTCGAQAEPHHGSAVAAAPPPSCTGIYPGSYYATFSGLGLNCATQLLIMPWFVVDPTVSSGYLNSGTYNTLAKALVPQGYTSILGLGGAGSPTYWPEHVGSDNGEMAAIKAAPPLSLIGGVVTDSTSGTTVNSPQSMRTTATGASALSQLWGYNAGDEPQCSMTDPSQGPDVSLSVVNGIKTNGADTTRPIFWNFEYKYIVEAYACKSTYDSVLAAISFSSFDWYPNIGTFPIQYILNADHIHLSSGTVANDGNDFIWAQGMATSYMHDKVPTHPVTPFVDGMNDAFGASEAANIASATLTNGSTTLTIAGYAGLYPAKLTTQAGNGLTVTDTTSGGLSCIQSGTTITVTGALTATMSKPAVCGAAGLSDTVTFSGGPGGGGCNVNSLNLCEPMLNEWRLTASQFYSEVWEGYLNYAYGHSIFQQDNTSALFSFGDSINGGAAATAAATNISYVQNDLLAKAALLNRPHDGCTMQSHVTPYPTTSTCTTANGTVLTTGTAAIPGQMFTVTSPGGTGIYLFAQSDRVSASGATFTYNFGATFAGQVATICYDKRTHYDPTNAKTIGATHTLNGSGIFSDTIGDGGAMDLDDYDVLIYAVGIPCAPYL